MSPSEIGLILLIIIVGVAVSIMIKGQEVKEGFANKPVARVENFPNITFCPFNSTAVITNSGESLCCEGETSRKVGCLQKTVCSLSNSFGKNYGPCSKVYGEYIKKMSRSCPKSLPSYFEKRDPANKNIIVEKGCYAGATHPNKYEPVSKQQKTCKLYESKKDSDLNINSCLNQKNLDDRNNNLKYQGGGKAQFVIFRKNTPPLIQITQMRRQKVFGGEVEMPEVTYTWPSLTRYWKYVWPEYTKFNLDDFSAQQLMFVYEIGFGLKRGFFKPGDKKLFSSFLRHRDYWL
jgi:hypothetical protein